MIIDPDIVLQAKRDANAFFKPHHALPSPRSSRSASPLPSQRSARRPEPYNYHSEYDRQLLLSPYITDTDVDSHPRSEPYGLPTYPLMPPLRTAGRPPPPPTPLHSPGWTTVNQSYYSSHHPRSTFNPNEELHSLNVDPSATRGFQRSRGLLHLPQLVDGGTLSIKHHLLPASLNNQPPPTRSNLTTAPNVGLTS
jgi:hypothetical protein